MDSDTITLNECANDGTKMHLYYSAETDMWVSFGNSAFILATLAKKEHVGYVDGFSVRMQMPTVVLSSSGVRVLSSICVPVREESGNHIIFHPNIRICENNYLQWVKGLREVKQV